jgi:murein DD-endopeptidase MepM/ murein hydrolase activator NlpD
VYAHLDPDKILVGKNDTVTKGNVIADGLKVQTYNGQDNTHLHWEMRYFADGSGIKTRSSNYTVSASGEPGPGYSYPDHPDYFVANGGAGPIYRWTNPSFFIENH